MTDNRWGMLARYAAQHSKTISLATAMLSLIATVALAIFAFMQIGINKDISATNRASNRAFIFFEEAALVPYPSAKAVLDRFESGGFPKVYG